MNNFGILIKNNILVFWGSLKRRKKGRYAASGVLMALLLLFVGFTLASQSVVTTVALAAEGIPDLSIFMSLMSALTIGILFGLMRAANAPGSRDAELLLSLPVRRVTAVCSKVITQYIFDSPLMLMIFAPTVISHYVLGGGNAGTLVRGLILTFLLPLIPIALSYLLGAVLAILQEKFKLTSIITTGILMVLLIGYMFVNFQSSSILSSVTGGGKAGALAMIEKFAPLSWLTHFVLDGGILPVMFSLLMLLVPFCLGIWLYASAFGKPKTGYRSSSRILAFSARSPRMALLDKEVKRYLACSIYVFNTAFGPLILLIFAVIVVVLGPDKIISGMGVPAAELGALSKDLTFVILAGIFCLFPSMTSTTASSISLEGKQLWILKAHPISTDDVFWSKYMLNILLLVPASVLASILIGVRVQMSPVQIVGFAVVPGLLGVLVSLIGLITNLLLPRFDWDNETAVVKQSMSVLMAMVFGFAAACIPFILYFVFLQKFGFSGFCVIGILVYGALSAGSYFFLRTAGKKIFEAL